MGTFLIYPGLSIRGHSWFRLDILSQIDISDMSTKNARNSNSKRQTNVRNTESRVATAHLFSNTGTGNNSSSCTMHYAVNLRISPVETGITCQSSRWHTHQFKGLGAFNFYFDYLLPNSDGFSLPDIWDGNFHITLGKFELRSDDENQKQSLMHYIRDNIGFEQHYRDIFPCRFRTKKLQVYDGYHRDLEMRGIDFVALIVEDCNHVWEQLHPLLKIIQNGVEQVQGIWKTASLERQRDQMHVTVKKYRNDKWSRQYIDELEVSDRVSRAPLEFECVSLEVVPSRRQANHVQREWWIGVTGIPLACGGCGSTYPDKSPGYCRNCKRSGPDHYCSGCKRREHRQQSWPGFCCRCGEFEQLKPLWSTLKEQ